MKIYLETEKSRNISILAPIEEKIANCIFLGEVINKEDLTSDECFKIDDKYYTVCTASLKNDEYENVIITEINLSDNKTTQFEDDITCPACGFYQEGSWEYSVDFDENYKCPVCGSLLEWQRHVEVTYNTTLKKRVEPKTIEVKND